MARVGRPRIGVERKARVTVMLDTAQHEYLKAFGGGNVSAALQLIIDRSMTWHARKYPGKPGYRLSLPAQRARS
jgi:hypothetical protein